MLSQNVLFVAEASVSEGVEHPPGEGIANGVADRLREQGYRPCEIDNWRDCGWSIDLKIEDALLQIALASTTEPMLWMAQVACVNQPGFFARLFGPKAVDRSAELFDVALAIHRALVEAGYREIRWCIDGYPDDGDNSPEPKCM